MKNYSPHKDNFYYEKQELKAKLLEYEKEEESLFEKYIKEGIEVVKIETINYYDSTYKSNITKFKLTDINGLEYVSVFNHNSFRPLYNSELQSFDVYQVEKEFTNYKNLHKPNARYTFYLPYMKLTKYLKLLKDER